MGVNEVNTVSFMDRDNAAAADLLQGTGVKEFDDALRERSKAIEKLMDKDDDKSKDELQRMIDEIGKEAKEDKNVDKHEDDKIDKATSKIKEAVEGGKDIATAATPVLLSEIKSIKKIDNSSYELTLHDGSKVIADRDVNKEAFGIAEDFKDQLRVVDAEGKDLIEDGYGLMGNNELKRLEAELDEAKEGPKIGPHGDNIYTVEYTDKDDKKHKYFAYNGHSQSAFDFMENLYKKAPSANIAGSGGL